MYRIIVEKMTWRSQKSGYPEPEAGVMELEKKVNALAKEGYELDRLVFNNIPQGEGFIDAVYAYAVMKKVRRKRE